MDCRCGERQPGDAAIGVLPGMRGGLPGGLSGFPFEGNVTGIATGDFTAAPVYSAVAGSRSRIATGDFDRDGRLDVLMQRTFGGLIVTMRNTGGDGSSAGAVLYLPAAGEMHRSTDGTGGSHRGIAW